MADLVHQDRTLDAPGRDPQLRLALHLLLKQEDHRLIRPRVRAIRVRRQAHLGLPAEELRLAGDIDQVDQLVLLPSARIVIEELAQQLGLVQKRLGRAIPALAGDLVVHDDLQLFSFGKVARHGLAHPLERLRMRRQPLDPVDLEDHAPRDQVGQQVGVHPLDE